MSSSAMKVFERAAGLDCNVQKSQIFLDGCGEGKCRQILDILRMDKGVFPIRYLGAPLIDSRILNKHCGPLVRENS